MTGLPELTSRDGLPDPLRVLAKEFPRDLWAGHPNYSQMIEFWLSRHLMFRQLLDQLERDTNAALDKGIDTDAYKARLHRFGGLLINELHTHHTVEDTHYFPLIAKLDARVETGFEILDSDHHAMDEQLHLLANGANAVLQSPQADAAYENIGGFHESLQGFAPLLNRHLLDEEELVVPIILKHNPAELR